MSMQLHRFTKDEICIHGEDAYALLRFFFLNPGIPVSGLTDEDIICAQALLLEAVDASYKVGLIKIVYDTFFMKIPLDFQNLSGMVKSFVKKAVISWWNHATQKDLENPQIFEIVRSQLQSNFMSCWQIRLATGELTY